MYLSNGGLLTLKIVETKKVKVEKMSGGIFIGTAEVMPLIDESVGSEFRAGVVTFPPGTRNKFHAHDNEQILYVISGRGIVATEEEERVVTVGDIILIPAGENHWHGATEDSAFSHLYVMKAETKTTF
ncbi:MAG: cupin domain-containing protein [Candidatus Bathyarchaeia archaeon]